MDDEISPQVQVEHAHGADWYVLVLLSVPTVAHVSPAHEAAVHAAKLRVELSQSRREQHEYLKNVELARVLDKRAERKRKTGEGDANEPHAPALPKKQKLATDSEGTTRSNKGPKRERAATTKPGSSTESTRDLSRVLGSIF